MPEIDKETKKWRGVAQKSFDEFWKSEGLSRIQAYCWLASEFGFMAPDFHIGFLNIIQCKYVIEICKAKGSDGN